VAATLKLPNRGLIFLLTISGRSPFPIVNEDIRKVNTCPEHSLHYFFYFVVDILSVMPIIENVMSNTDTYRNQTKCLEKIEVLKEKTKELYPNLDLPRVPISFNLRGQTAGMVRYYKGAKIKDLRLNLDILNNPKHTDDFIAQTVPHEWAHVVQRLQHGHRDSRGQRIQPHGIEWKKIMRDLGVEVKRCHSYEVTKARTVRTVDYKCDKCEKVMEFTLVRHNKCVRRGARYRHGAACGGELKRA